MGVEALLVASLASTAVSTVGGIVQARQQAKINEANADAANEIAAAKAAKLRRDNLRRIGAANAAFGAAGVTIDGTPQDVLADMALTAEENVALTMAQGAADARNFDLQADAARQRGFGVAIQGGLQAGRTALTFNAMKGLPESQQQQLAPFLF